MRTTTLALALALTLASAAPAFAQQAERVAVQPVLIDDRAALSPDAAQLAEFDAFVESVRKQFEVPGIAVAIVQDGIGRDPTAEYRHTGQRIALRQLKLGNAS